MKKTLIALAALAATGAAFAQSSVSLYGRLDVGYSNNVTTEDAGANSTETKNNGVGVDTLSTNYWGMKGSEDLGGGLKANFNLEAGLTPDNGMFNAGGFNRISTLGLEGGFGRVDLGRYYTPLFQTAAMSDVFGVARTTTVNLAGADGIRSSDGIFYASPSFGGFSGKAMWSANDAGVATNGTTTAAATSNRNVGLSATYANGPLLVSAAMGLNETANAGASTKAESTAFSGTYNFGVAKLFAGYITQKSTPAAQLNANVTSTETNLGVSVPFGKTTVMAGYGRNTKSSDVAASYGNVSGDDFIVGVTYDLSKRTTAYAKTGTYNKFSGSVAGADSASKTVDTSIGIRHLF